MEDLINDFVAISGASRSEAQNYLAASNNDLNEAIERFYASSHSSSSAPIFDHKSATKKKNGNFESSELYSVSSSEDEGEILEKYSYVEDISSPTVRKADPIQRMQLNTNDTRYTIVSGTVKNNLNPFSGVHGPNADNHQKKLANLYRKPQDIMFSGPLDVVKRYYKYKLL